MMTLGCQDLPRSLSLRPTLTLFFSSHGYPELPVRLVPTSRYRVGLSTWQTWGDRQREGKGGETKVSLPSVLFVPLLDSPSLHPPWAHPWKLHMDPETSPGHTAQPTGDPRPSQICCRKWECCLITQGLITTSLSTRFPAKLRCLSSHRKGSAFLQTPQSPPSPIAPPHVQLGTCPGSAAIGVTWLCFKQEKEDYVVRFQDKCASEFAAPGKGNQQGHCPSALPGVLLQPLGFPPGTGVLCTPCMCVKAQRSFGEH